MGVNETLDELVRLARARDERDKQAAIEQAREQQKLRGIKTGFRLPILRATGTNPFSMGGTSGTGQTIQGAREGFALAIRSIVITGMTRTATPDIIQILRDSAGGTVLWELNGNSYGQTFGVGEKWLRPGETIFYQSIGAFASTNVITAYVDVDEYPAERAGVAVD